MTSQLESKNLRILVTGAAGFVGHAFCTKAERAHPQWRIIRAGRGVVDKTTTHTITTPQRDCIMDIINRDEVFNIIKKGQFTHILHLAGIAAVTASTDNPHLAWNTHVFGSLNIAEAILNHSPQTQLIFISSGQVYGATAKAGAPLTENMLLQPSNDYAVTKAAAELALGALNERGLQLTILRPFNHTGPGQNEDFVVPNFAMQIARAEAGLSEPVIKVGNLDAMRDFLDVEDVAQAYIQTIAQDSSQVNGLTMNISSGHPRSILSILEALLSMSTIKIRVQHDENRMRPSDTPLFIGHSGLAASKIGFKVQSNINDTLKAVLDHARSRVRAETKA